MLEDNWRRLDELGGPRLSAARQERSAATAAPAPTETPAVRRLNERFGVRWRYDITERKRDGDEVIVLCRLTLDDGSATRTQFGRARIGGGGGGTIHGSVDGIAFTTNSAGAAPAGISDAGAEEAAYLEAVEAALAKCAEMV